MCSSRPLSAFFSALSGRRQRLRTPSVGAARCGPVAGQDAPPLTGAAASTILAGAIAPGRRGEKWTPRFGTTLGEF